MKASRLTAFALMASMVAAAIIVAGCSGTGTGTPTPTPTPTPTVAPTQTASPTPLVPSVSPAVEKEYQLVEHLYNGIDDYNSGVSYVKIAENLVNASDYTNGSEYYQLASDRMSVAKADFDAMLPYAGNGQEISLSQKWSEASGLYAMSYQNASYAYAEYAYEYARPVPNYVKYGYYAGIAQQYNDMAAQSRSQADAIESGMTFLVPTSVPAQ